jgi:serine/threonine protein kinase
MKLSNLVGQALDGKYRIEKQLGKGGMGAVFFATHLGTERPVAVKVIMPQYMKHDEFVERFRREARAAGRLRHPNVVDVTDFGFANVGDEEVAYLVMEYLDGCTLDEILEEEGKIPFSFMLDIIEQVCSAVEEAHQQGIIHRDLKPDNIWLEPNRRGSYTVKVLDFGIAKLEEASFETEEQISSSGESKNNKSITGKFSFMDSEDKGTLLFKSQTSPSVSAYQESEFAEDATHIQSAPVVTNPEEITEAETKEMDIVALAQSANSEAVTKRFDSSPTDTQHHRTSSANALTRIGSVLGTPLYMSPEQCSGKTLDARSDVYSLGVISYQMLSGETPFKGEYQEVMKSHIEKQPPLLKVKGVRRKSARVVMTALAKDAESRPPSAAAFASILRANSEGVGTLFQRTLTLFSRHLPIFVKITLIVFAPLIIFTLLQVTNNLLGLFDLIPKRLSGIIGVLDGILIWVTAIFSESVLVAVTTWVVAGIQAAPLKPVEIKPAFIALRRRLKPFVWTSFLLLVISTFLCFLLPVTAVVFALVSSVVIVEGKKGIAAMKRSYRLVRRTLRTVIAAVIIQFIVPVILTAAIMSIIALVVTAIFKSREINQAQNTQTSQTAQENKDNNNGGVNISNKGKGWSVTFGDEKGSKRGDIIGNTFQLVWLPIQVVLGMFAAILKALLYLKARQAGGESIKEVLEEFEDERKRAKWQMKMRDRLSLHTRTSKS